MPSSRVNPISPTAQLDLGFGTTPEQLQKKKPAAEGYKEIHAIHNPTEKDPKGKAAENKEFADNRVKPSPLNVNAEIARMKEALDKSSKGSGSSSTGIPKTNRDLMKNNKAGGIIRSSASNRADGCAIRGKTRA